MIRLLREERWSGGLPGYGDAVQGLSVISTPPAARLAFSDGRIVRLPEPANQVCVSDGGKWAWQGHESGLIYEGLSSTGRKGYGQNSFLYVGESLQIFTDVQTYQQTSGGWRYVDEQGRFVSYGATYSGPPLWEYTKFADGLSIGQGPEDNDGLCVAIPGEGFIRQLVAGNAHNIRVRRYADDFIITVVFYTEQVTRVFAAALSDLKALPPIVRQHPDTPPVQPSPPQEPKSMEFPNHLDVVQRERAKFPQDTLTEEQCFTVTNAVASDPAVRADGWGLTKAPAGGSGFIVNGQNYRLDKLCHPNGYINDILSDTPGAAGAQWGASADANGNASNWAPAVQVATNPRPPTPNPQPPTAPPAPTVDLSSVLAALAEIKSRQDEQAEWMKDVDEKLEALSARPQAAQGPMFGTVAIPYLGSARVDLVPGTRPQGK